MFRPESQETLPSLKLCQDLSSFVAQVCSTWMPPTVTVQAEFYPYTSLKSTVREKHGVLRFRLSDLLRDAPDQVVEAITVILLHRIERRPPPRAIEQLYREWARQPHIRERIRKSRGSRGRKQVLHPRGRHHDLRTYFADLNTEFFNNEVDIQLLGWSRRRARTVLGHYDAAHRSITVSRLLDHPKAPDFVIRFVLFHEMLHAFLGEEERASVRVAHHSRFRAAEKDFPEYEEARHFIRSQLCRLV